MGMGWVVPILNCRNHQKGLHPSCYILDCFFESWGAWTPLPRLYSLWPILSKIGPQHPGFVVGDPWNRHILLIQSFSWFMSEREGNPPLWRSTPLTLYHVQFLLVVLWLTFPSPCLPVFGCDMGGVFSFTPGMTLMGTDEYSLFPGQGIDRAGHY